MTALAEGNVDATVPTLQRQDEIGRMVDALTVFRDTPAKPVACRRMKPRRATRRRPSAAACWPSSPLPSRPASMASCNPSPAPPASYRPMRAACPTSPAAPTASRVPLPRLRRMRRRMSRPSLQRPRSCRVRSARSTDRSPIRRASRLRRCRRSGAPTKPSKGWPSQRSASAKWYG
ncbi:MAG: hypothetical protein WDN69_14365 [Aliidongia sp.]